MAIKQIQSGMTVVEAAKLRIRNIFSNKLPVYMSFSGGKDSLCLASLVMDLIQTGEIDAGQLTVQFIDEEAIFPCIEQTVKEWRKKFLMVGARFDWYCMQYRHFNCFNQLENDESFICWDAEKQDRWVRTPPAYAIRHSKYLREREDTYQEFLDKRCADGIVIVGIRTAESLQRLQNLARVNNKPGGKGRKKLYPIYDWKNNDVWLYLKEHHINIPEIYLYMWQAGANKNQMRVSQFFSVDTARSLVKMNEYYPGLMDRIIRREPNAYLAALYWDSEMFGRSSRARKASEGESGKDYRKLIHEALFQNFDILFDTPHKKKVARSYKNFYLQVSQIITERQMKTFYESLMGGDPKLRNLRALYQNVYTSYNVSSRKEVNGY